jgi:hypothetical protein
LFLLLFRSFPRISSLALAAVERAVNARAVGAGAATALALAVRAAVLLVRAAASINKRKQQKKKNKMSAQIGFVTRVCVCVGDCLRVGLRAATLAGRGVTARLLRPVHTNTTALLSDAPYADVADFFFFFFFFLFAFFCCGRCGKRETRIQIAIRVIGRWYDTDSALYRLSLAHVATKSKEKKNIFFFFGFFAAKTAERYLRARVRVGAIARLERVALARELERQHALGVHSRQHNTQKQHNGNHF